MWRVSAGISNSDFKLQFQTLYFETEAWKLGDYMKGFSNFSFKLTFQTLSLKLKFELFKVSNFQIMNSFKVLNFQSIANFESLRVWKFKLWKFERLNSLQASELNIMHYMLCSRSDISDVYIICCIICYTLYVIHYIWYHMHYIFHVISTLYLAYHIL